MEELKQPLREKAGSRPRKAVALEQICHELELDAQRLEDETTEPPDEAATRELNLVHHKLVLAKETATLARE